MKTEKLNKVCHKQIFVKVILILALVHTSNLSCTEHNVNDLSSLSWFALGEAQAESQTRDLKLVPYDIWLTPNSVSGKFNIPEGECKIGVNGLFDCQGTICIRIWFWVIRWRNSSTAYRNWPRRTNTDHLLCGKDNLYYMSPRMPEPPVQRVWNCTHCPLYSQVSGYRLWVQWVHDLFK